jgi:hypothetical protein
MPIGWGFHPTPKGEFDRACAETRNETHCRRQRVEKKASMRVRTVIRGSHIGRMHMRIALWLSGLDQMPTVAEACALMGIHHDETMRRLLSAYRAAIGQGWTIRESRNSSRVLHMRFALWASGLNREITHTETQQHLGVVFRTAQRLVADWKTLQQEKS